MSHSMVVWLLQRSSLSDVLI